MSKKKYTPGPWSVSIYETPKNRTNPVQVTVIATGMSIRINGHRQEANAHLIAAAPDLLAVTESNLKILKALYDTPTESGVFNSLEYQLLEQALADTEAAIAAAKGEVSS